MAPQRSFHIRTYGCQMNVHDTRKVANLLAHHGWREAPDADAADLLLINTCSIREKAEHRLYSDLGALRAWKGERAGRVLGVGGCVAQQEGEGLLERFAHLDFAYGTHHLRSVPGLAEAAGLGVREARVGEVRSQDRFDLPELHPDREPPSDRTAFVTVMEGCDMFCSFCIVPTTRGREISRAAEAIVAEVGALAARGVREVTLLGQTVNAYGRHDVRRGRAEAAGTLPFALLLARVAAVPGIERVRYTSPHPLFFDAALVRAHAELPELCPHVHLPLQSGSDRVLERMRRRYTGAEFLAIVASLRAARPDVALTTDLIVGFPGETEEDFRDTLAVVEAARFVDGFSFKYSPRPGTAASALPDAVPPDVAQARLERLQALLGSLTRAAHEARVGTRTTVLVGGASRRGGSQLQGRDPYHRVVNLEPAAAGPVPAPGDLVAVEIVGATPHSLLATPLGPASARPPAGPGAELFSQVKKSGHLADEAGRIRGGDAQGSHPRG